MASVANDEKRILKHISDGVEKLEAELNNKNFPECNLIEERDEILTSRITDCEKYEKKLKHEKYEVNKTLERIRTDLAQLKQNPEEQKKKLEEFDEELSAIVKDLDNMEDARQQVNSITQEQFAMLKNLRRPPKVLEEVLIGIAYLFGVQPEDGHDSKSSRKRPKFVRWADAKRFMIQMETKDKILKFNPLICKMEDIEKTRNWIKAHSSSFKMSRIKRASKSFAPLSIFLSLSMELAVKYKDTMDLNVRRITLSQRTNWIRKQLARSKQDTTYIENMEKKVASIYAKQLELEEKIKRQRRRLQARREERTEIEMKGEEVNLHSIETVREEYRTQVFFDWKNMMKSNKQKKKNKKKKKQEKNNKAKPLVEHEEEETKMICRLSGMDSETMEAARQKDRQSYVLEQRQFSTRRLTGMPEEPGTRVKVWCEGKGWVISEETKEDSGEVPMMRDDEQKESVRKRPVGSASVMKGLIMRLRSKSRMRQSVVGNDLMKFLSILRIRLDEIDIELEQKQLRLSGV